MLQTILFIYLQALTSKRKAAKLYLIPHLQEQHKSGTNTHSETHWHAHRALNSEIHKKPVLKRKVSSLKSHGPVHLSFQCCVSPRDGFIPSLLQLYHPFSHEVCKLTGQHSDLVGRGRESELLHTVHLYQCVKVCLSWTLKYYLLLWHSKLLTMHCSFLEISNHFLC